jgi:hypothetical protein
MLPKTNSQKERNKMSNSIAPMMAPVELTELELDAVAGGQPTAPRNVALENLVNVQVNLENLQVGVAANVLGDTVELIQNL